MENNIQLENCSNLDDKGRFSKEKKYHLGQYEGNCLKDNSV